ncbi:MAG: CapA family protein [Phormidesmis sp.]
MASATQTLEVTSNPATSPTTSNPAQLDTQLNISHWSLSGLDIQQMAAEGYFQAIAYWLNERLVPHNVYAQVLADERPGRLKILIEFERAPHPQRLIRFVCDRLYKLNSDIIEGIHLIVRPLGTAKTDWEKRIRIPPASQRQPAQQRQQQRQKQPPNHAQTSQLETVQSTPQLLHESLPAKVARQAVRSQFKFFRAALISGVTAAAFLFGGLTELVLSDRLSVIAVDSPSDEAVIPWYQTDTAEAELSQNATEVSFRQASRFQGSTVEAALETVAVISHDAVAHPDDPTVTLLFGGELSLNDFTFEAASDLDQLFADITIYEQADVSMVGLAEPLAYASTSLQEDFYNRTRPQAVQALKAGGIDIVGLASEGTMTYGTSGLGETLDNLDRQGIYRIGAGRNEQEAHRPEILEVKGQRIAYLGYNPDALEGAKSEKAGVALANSENRQHIIEDIKAIRSQVDWIVVNYRWGDPLNTLGDTSSEPTSSETAASAAISQTSDEPISTGTPADWQKTLAREAVDAGADLVVGYHPSQVQGAEIYHDRAIAYSLGDFVFNNAPLADHDTAALRVSLRNQQMKVEFLPITIRDSKIEMATGEKGAAILQSIRDASRPFDQPMRFPKVLDTRTPNLLAPEPPLAAPAPVSDQPSNSEELDNWAENAAEADNSTVDWPTLDSTVDSPSDSTENTAAETTDAPPAPNPVMQESEALFIPTEETFTDEMPAEDVVPQNDVSAGEAPSDGTQTNWQDSLQDEALLEKWGKKTDSKREFVPIPERAAQRQHQDEAASAESAPIKPAFIEPASVEPTPTESTSAEPSSAEPALVE